MLNASFVFKVHAACPATLILPDFIAVTKLQIIKSPL
jgi:hypothetical protein